MKNKLIYWLLIFILIIGGCCRFYKLGSAPKGLYSDEAAIGYNAYSVLLTGKDEFGYKLPLLFRSFATFQAPIYTYITVPFVKFLGLSVFSTRLPSAIFGFLTIIMFFFLIRSISPKEIRNEIALISTLVLAISPWHIIFSRTAYETNVALFFLVFGLLLFFKSLKVPMLLPISSVLFSVSILAYAAERIMVPLLILLLVSKNWKFYKDNLNKYLLPAILSVIIGFILLYPTLLIVRTPGFLARVNVLNIFSYQRQMPAGFISNYQGWLSKVVNFKPLLTLKEWSSLYLSYFSPRYLFSLGDSGPRSPYSDLSTFYIWQFPFYLYGLYKIIREKKLGDLKFMTIVLLLVSPIAASMTREPYSTIRALAMVVPQSVIIGLGIFSIFNKGIKRNLKYLGILILSLGSMAKLYSSIMVQSEYFKANYWEYGIEDTLNVLDKLDNRYPIVWDNNRGNVYIQILFFKKFNPESYQKTNFEVNGGEYYSNMSRNVSKKIGDIEIREIVWGDDTDHVEKYLVGDALSISDVQIREHGLIKIQDINYPDGNLAYRIVKTNPNLLFSD
ncbi:MAG: glycosyltransferase family 39 protein [Candidatus Shapirobacteria bacterium]|nr:glycosyltransferase family 39 protein [Candidatus Shapirobacteria bacterium]